MTTTARSSPLTDAELARYARHISLPQVGLEGQLRLKAAAVAIVGAGGLGSPAALYLAAAGIGRIGIIDFDRVDLSNLHRQVLHGTSDLDRPKIESARERLRDINPEIEIDAHGTSLSSANALDILRPYDIILDGSDNFATRYLVNDAAVLLGKPDVYGSIFRFEGQVSIFGLADGPCYRCLYPEPPPPGLIPSCAEGGVIGVLPGVIGMLQATEAVKLFLGIGEPLAGRLLLFDALQMSFRELRLRKSPDCALCGPNPTIRALIDYERFCGGPPAESDGDEITPAELAARLERGDSLRLIDVREVPEWRSGRIEGAEHIPLGTIVHDQSRLKSDEEIVLYCRSGSRSANALEALRAAGFSNLRSLAGGIDRWAREVGPPSRP
ncbi:MAG TPA: molybdopterin-synthase adenylyltransferase MoeB [Thermoanaerobaculia bacterium]|nr:molybdopterin-synthase adenylyltransferase MoeB [Thermoanaerobaculia bacterium]